MNDLESKLRSARLAAPSPDLDRRMENAFLNAGRARRGSRQPLFWWWLATAAGGLAALVFLSLRQPPPVPEVTVYRFEAQGRMREMLVNPAASREGQPHFVFHVSPP